MNLSYLFYEDDDDRLLYEIYRRSTALATEHATRDRPHYNCVRAINRYARKLIEWASSGYEGQEPLPSKPGQRLMGSEVQKAAREMVFEEIENHIAKMEAEVTAIRARQERIRELTSESLAADALCELIDSV